jgi:hypothetical protein
MLLKYLQARLEPSLHITVLYSKAQALIANIRLGWKYLSVPNTLAYYIPELIMSEKSFLKHWSLEIFRFFLHKGQRNFRKKRMPYFLTQVAIPKPSCEIARVNATLVSSPILPKADFENFPIFRLLLFVFLENFKGGFTRAIAQCTVLLTRGQGDQMI